jgi:hypothetical protein
MKKPFVRVESVKLSKREEAMTFLSGLLATLAIFIAFPTYYSFAETETLTVTVQQTMTFSVSTDVFGTLIPNTPKYATSTISMNTTNDGGYNVILSCDSKTTTEQCLKHSDLVTYIPDKASWSVPAAAATTTAGNSSLVTNGTDVLAFRVYQASSSVGFRSATWWGSVDAYPGAATTLWAGIASSTNASRIGNDPYYSASTRLSTVNYYLDVSPTQKGGDYSATLTYTGTAN